MAHLRLAARQTNLSMPTHTLPMNGSAPLARSAPGESGYCLCSSRAPWNPLMMRRECQHTMFPLRFSEHRDSLAPRANINLLRDVLHPHVLARILAGLPVHLRMSDPPAAVNGTARQPSAPPLARAWFRARASWPHWKSARATGNTDSSGCWVRALSSHTENFAAHSSGPLQLSFSSMHGTAGTIATRSRIRFFLLVVGGRAEHVGQAYSPLVLISVTAQQKVNQIRWKPVPRGVILSAKR
jgi:hypothetical protein